MGQSEPNTQINNMLKFAFVVCCAALASAEPEAKPEAKADPALVYGAYAGYPYAAGYAGYSYGYPYAYGLYGKRSADAEPEADAYYYGYARPYAYGYRSYIPSLWLRLLRKEIC